jgi:2-keto-myo-inositol isomerase
LKVILVEWFSIEADTRFIERFMATHVSRRQILQTAGMTAAGWAAAAALPARGADTSEKSSMPFRFSFNTSTIREQKVGIVREIEITAEAGYDAIEPWMDTLHRYVEEGGSLPDLRKRIADAGLTVESAIGFAQWIVDDDEARRGGLEQARRDMDLLARIGAHDRPGPDLATVAARYRVLLELGDGLGIVPQVELWGFSKTLNRLGEAAYVALESGHRSACVLADVYHLHKGGSDFETLKLLSGLGAQVFHMNDYPADPPAASITDAHRVYPGDGVAPLKKTLKDLRQAGFAGVLSLELFNREYWKQDPLRVAKTGLEKMRAVAQASLA